VVLLGAIRPSSTGNQARSRSVIVSSANGVPADTFHPVRRNSSAPHPEPVASRSTGSASAISNH
jgi:hypothetical protein